MTDSLALHSGDYVERYNRKPLDRVRNLARLMQLPPAARLADFACGNAMLLHALGRREGLYEGIDFSPDFIAAAQAWAEREECVNYRFHCAEIAAFCAEHPATFDAAATFDFSEHITDEVAIPIYAAIRQSLVPGGTLYLHTPNGQFFIEWAKNVGIMRQFPEHVAVRNGDETIALLIKAGFPREGIRLRMIPHYNVLRLLAPLARMPLIGKWFEARIWIEART